MLSKLQPGVRTYCEARLPKPECRMMLNDGTWEAIDCVGETGVPYVSPAFLPRSNWRELREDDADVLLAEQGSSAPPDRTIQVLRMPDEVLAPFREDQGVLRKTIADCRQVFHHPGYTEKLVAAVPHLARYFASPAGVRVLGICINPPGMRTATTHRAGGAQYMSGLHIDSWDGVSLGERARRRSKMCINIGASDRFFMFINLPLPDLLKTARAEPGAHNDKDPATAVGFAFMKRHPDYPVVKVRIRPGEAYLAPTENMIHDGSTSESDTPDVTINLLGHLQDELAPC